MHKVSSKLALKVKLLACI